MESPVQGHVGANRRGESLLGKRREHYFLEVIFYEL